MARWPLQTRPTRAVSTPRALSTASTITVTASSTIHTKGVWAEITASVTSPVRYLMLYPASTFTSGAATSMLLDIGIGAAGSEVVVIPDLLVGYLDAADSNQGCGYIAIPVDVPSNTRLAARIQALIVSDTLRLTVDQLSGAAWPGVPTGGPITAYGIAAASSKGTVVTADTVVNVKGAWADLSTSTARTMRQLIFLAQPNARVVAASETWTFDVGLWNGSSYDVIVPDLMCKYLSNENWRYQSPTLVPLGFSIPAASRIGVRASCATASLTADVAVYGMG